MQLRSASLPKDTGISHLKQPVFSSHFHGSRSRLGGGRGGMGSVIKLFHGPLCSTFNLQVTAQRTLDHRCNESHTRSHMQRCTDTSALGVCSLSFCCYGGWVLWIVMLDSALHYQRDWTTSTWNFYTQRISRSKEFDFQIWMRET